MNPLIGTCSWNYPSWKNLVYTKTGKRAVDYLPEYSSRYRTVEIDSWFYRIPDPITVNEYLKAVDSDFRFTCKIPNKISLTHQRPVNGSKELIENPFFLSNEVFEDFLNLIEPMLPRIDALMLEFEYLNRSKMPSMDVFLRKLEEFCHVVPAGIPLAVEIRNKNYLHEEYFNMLHECGIIHVFSEKIFMPPITQVYAQFGHLLNSSSVIRLLGGDRREIEKTTDKKWNRIVEPKDELVSIIKMTKDLISRGKRVTINVNNHYEGSAPLTIAKIEELLR
ncbi:MAG: DUF72 domain-containing protein [Spirochaetales bacterium]|uniref:DUF72 domain-containing protein n=1 Tax=Candidatus Thalassospirochaeta sargassi TaxID=3119039 RepID=A0AAJ1IEQ2_9SPIO|nr:DUF72 domain-containing protein [Spirochaetales bacterium]